MSFPGVVEAAVVAEPCPVLGRACACLRGGGAARALANLKRHCAGLLADYKVPDAMTLRREPLPRNANGKLLSATCALTSRRGARAQGHVWR